MSILFPHFVRGIVSSIMNTFLMLSLLQPKYGKKLTNLTMLGIMALNLMAALFSYINNDLSLLMRLNIIIFTITCFLIRPLFKDSFMQWLFSYITVLNISMCIVILSFSISRFMPSPIYANSLIRFIMYALIIFVIRRYLQPEYRKIVTRWNVFFFVALTIFITFVYYLTRGNDIIQTLVEQTIPLHLLVLITSSVYISLFQLIKTISLEYELREDNLRMKNNQDLLYLSTSDMGDRIKLLDEIQAQNSISNHDRRHFNNTLLELLKDNMIEDAIEFLKKQSNVQVFQLKKYCENTLVNAATSYYIGIAEEKGIVTKVNIDIPNTLTVESIELAMVISNLLDNAINACDALGDERKPEISFTCRNVGRLVVEVINPCHKSIRLDEKGYPMTKESNHGIGTKSVLAFAEKNDSELIYKIEEGIFSVRMII